MGDVAAVQPGQGIGELRPLVQRGLQGLVKGKDIGEIFPQEARDLRDTGVQVGLVGNVDDLDAVPLEISRQPLQLRGGKLPPRLLSECRGRDGEQAGKGGALRPAVPAARAPHQVWGEQLDVTPHPGAGERADQPRGLEVLELGQQGGLAYGQGLCQLIDVNQPLLLPPEDVHEHEEHPQRSEASKRGHHLHGTVIEG